MSDTSQRVLVTGAAGTIGTSLRETLADCHLHLHDRDVSGIEPSANETTFEGDVSDLDSVRRAVTDCDSVVHLAADPRVPATWEDLRAPNIEGTYNIFEAASQAGVRRIVFASSNHATGMLDQQRQWPIDPHGPVAPDSLYGVSKAFGEAIGRYYAENSELTVACLRIGWVIRKHRPDNPDWRRMWLSFGDLGQLVRKALGADINFGIYYGVSANVPMRYDLDNARRDLGYEPVDNSADVVAESQPD